MDLLSSVEVHLSVHTHHTLLQCGYIECERDCSGWNFVVY